MSLGLGGCGTTQRASFDPPYETQEWIQSSVLQAEKILVASDFSMELVRFTDKRLPRSLEKPPIEQVIDSYDPGDLLQGLTVRLPAMYQQYLSFKPKQPKHYLIELELRELRTEIVRSGYFSNVFGAYETELEILATVRRPDSRVILQRGYRFREDADRTSTFGRSPSQEYDEDRLIALVDAAVRTTATNLAWDIHRTDARRWQPEAAAPVPTTTIRLQPERPLVQATGSATAHGSALVAPPPQPEVETRELQQPPIPIRLFGAEPY